MPTFGNTTAAGDTFPCTSDRALGSKFACPEAGTLTQINVQFDASGTAGSSGKALLYADSSGSPGALLATSSAVAIPAGGGDIAFPISYGSLVATDYWLVCVTNSFQSVFGIETTGVSQRKEAFTYASPADPFGTPTASATELCAYATYTAGGGGGGQGPRSVHQFGQRRKH